MLALLTMASVAWVVWDEAVTRRPWKDYQAEFNVLLTQRADPPEPIRIRQVTNPELDIVDRCESCHLGIDRPGFDDPEVPAVFRTHPRRDELLGSNHPIDHFGCTTCHAGQGPQTKGVGWADFDHGRDDPYWEDPMLTGVFVESRCVTCHADEDPIPGADAFNRGARLFEELRCTGCHESPLVEPVPAPGIPFEQLRTKVSQEFVGRFLRDRASYRSVLRMPEFWPPPADDSELAGWQEQRDREIDAITAFIGSLESGAPPEEPLPDDLDDPERIARGALLFDQVGCRGCHATGAIEEPPDRAALPFGPNLERVAERATVPWLAAWLRDPEAMWPNLRMPDLRLTDDERFDIVAFLGTLRSPEAVPLEARWDQAAPDLVADGRAVVERYGCYGCHEIPGFENAGRVGADLDDFGDKTPDQLAWGESDVECEGPELECWTTVKIQSPRSVQGQDLTLTMPDADLSDDDARALAVFVLAHRTTTVPEAYRHHPSEADVALQRGERLVAQRNCRGCHEIGRNEIPVMWDDEVIDVDYEPIGGEILQYYDVPTSGPPPLTFAGSKFQYDWVFEFLSAPTRIRPWLVVRHPSFVWTDEQKETVIRFFAARNDSPYPFVVQDEPVLAEEDRAEAIAMFEHMQCIRCHMLSSAESLEPGELSPDLALTSTRLRVGWLRGWLLDPQHVQPGTMMPTYFPLIDEQDPTSAITTSPDFLDGDVARQVEAIIALTFEFGRGAVHLTQTEPAAAP